MNITPSREETAQNLARCEDKGTYQVKLISTSVFPMQDEYATPGLSFTFELMDDSHRYIPSPGFWLKSYVREDNEVVLDKEGNPILDVRKSLLAKGKWIEVVARLLELNNADKLKLNYVEDFKLDMKDPESTKIAQEFQLVNGIYRLVPVDSRKKLAPKFRDDMDYLCLNDLIGRQITVDGVRDKDGYIIAKHYA